MSILKPVPIVPQPTKNLCPICGKASYSRDGIHPQCALQRADEPRNLKNRAAKKKEAKVQTPQQRVVEQEVSGLRNSGARAAFGMWLRTPIRRQLNSRPSTASSSTREVAPVVQASEVLRTV